jgi:hypothetical protein
MTAGGQTGGNLIVTTITCDGFVAGGDQPADRNVFGANNVQGNLLSMIAITLSFTATILVWPKMV